MEFEVLSSRHLARAIAQEITFDELIQRDESSSLDVIVAQADDCPPNLVLGNKHFAALMSELRQRYELVLIDAPSVSYDLDLLRIATFSDTTVLVVRQEMANGIGIQNAILKLHTAGKHITGMVLNGVRRQKRPKRFPWFRVLRKTAAKSSGVMPRSFSAPQSVR
jgi:Mrp family chromosome partitioning ATPase